MKLKSSLLKYLLVNSVLLKPSSHDLMKFIRMSKVDKFSHLKSLLEGAAARTIQGLTLGTMMQL